MFSKFWNCSTKHSRVEGVPTLLDFHFLEMLLKIWIGFWIIFTIKKWNLMVQVNIYLALINVMSPLIPVVSYVHIWATL